MIPFRISYTGRVAEAQRSIADRIYEVLKRGVIKGEIRPGTRLFEVEVAKNFDASRTPVREAFRRLEQDGLAERVAQGGIRVILLDERTVRDLFDLRVILETHAIELACDRITGEEIAILKQINVQASELLKSKDKVRDFALNMLFELNSAFHDTICSATRSKFLIKLLGNIRAVILSVRTISLRLDSLVEVWEDHGRIIGRLECRDKAAAVRLIHEHIGKTAVQILSYIRLQEPSEREKKASGPAGKSLEPAGKEEGRGRSTPS
jgi:DNA-binding GntR family transcriptional regulator